ncbi:MAG: hypothetical protein D6772_02675 [Bacteroidetes bacterium]|nr:MAG: hypothetical protein D6772_02675 [Bacteroidota bacterium]
MCYYLIIAIATWKISLMTDQWTTSVWTETLLHTGLLVGVVAILWITERKWLEHIWSGYTPVD